MPEFADKIITLICPVCKKSFIPAPKHIYRDKRTNHKVCSWSCVLKSERAMEDVVKSYIDTGAPRRVYRERRDTK